jgi:hypothetical protein
VELGHVLGTDARRDPVSTGQRRTTQDRPLALFQQVGGRFRELASGAPGRIRTCDSRFRKESRLEAGSLLLTSAHGLPYRPLLLRCPVTVPGPALSRLDALPPTVTDHGGSG